MTIYFIGYYIRARGLVEYSQRNSTSFSIFNPPAIYVLGSDIQAYSRLARSYILNYMLYTIIVIGTTLLVILFKRSIRVRKSLIAKQGTKKMSAKEAKLVQCVIAVCVIYIVCCTPLNVYDTIKSLGLLQRIRIVPYLDRLAFLARSVNHSVNIFAYLAINSSFRSQLWSLLCFSCHNGRSARA